MKCRWCEITAQFPMSSTCPRRHLRQQLPFTAQFTLTYDQIGSNKLKMKLRISLFSCLSLGCIGRNSCKLEVLCTADGQTQSQITSFQSIAPLSGRSSGFVRQYDNLRMPRPFRLFKQCTLDHDDWLSIVQNERFIPGYQS